MEKNKLHVLTNEYIFLRLLIDTLHQFPSAIRYINARINARIEYVDANIINCYRIVIIQNENLYSICIFLLDNKWYMYIKAAKEKEIKIREYSERTNKNELINKELHELDIILLKSIALTLINGAALT